MQDSASQYWLFRHYTNQEPCKLREKTLLAGIKLVAFHQLFFMLSNQVFQESDRQTDGETVLSPLKAWIYYLGPLLRGAHSLSPAEPKTYAGSQTQTRSAWILTLPPAAAESKAGSPRVGSDPPLYPRCSKPRRLS